MTDSYVLVSACRNEEAYIDGLVETVREQRLTPRLWVIVDDGSTDGTSRRVAEHARSLPFLRLAAMPGRGPRSFSSQVFAAQHGYELVKDLDFAFIGFLDADIRLGRDYYERLVERFYADPMIGLGGGIVLDQLGNSLGDIRQGSEDFHVAGGVQFFRRECFKQIGGYVPIDGGGQDTIADIMAMMHGWRIRSFSDLPAIHLRPDGYSRDNALARGMKWGKKFYLLGYHPLFYFCQCARRLGRPPVIVGSLCQLFGFAAAYLGSNSRPVSPKFVKFLRNIQMQRLRRVVAFGRVPETQKHPPRPIVPRSR